MDLYPAQDMAQRTWNDGRFRSDFFLQLLRGHLLLLKYHTEVQNYHIHPELQAEDKLRTSTYLQPAGLEP